MPPKITIVVPTFNEEKNLEKCLDSIFSQNYPKAMIEVIIVDDSSTDSTLEIAKKYPVKIFTHRSHDGEVGKKIALEKATGELFVYIDSDIHLRGNNWLKRMVKPLVADEKITASFTRYYNDSHSTIIERYLNLDPLQRDPIYQYFSPSIASVITQKKQNYSICTYEENKIPPAGLCLHRISILRKAAGNNKRFLELDILVNLVERGHNIFAYVENAGLFHHHVKSLSDLIKKRSRNVTKVYLPDNEIRKYRWFNLSDWRGVIKVIIWITLANLILPFTLVGLYKAIKNKTTISLLDPIVVLLVTDAIIISFLSDSRGRKLFLPK